MNGTPRLRSAFPATPPSGGARSGQYAPSGGIDALRATVQAVIPPDAAQAVEEPLIPTQWADPPTQRFWVAVLYGGIWIWRLWDFAYLNREDTESLWAFLRWTLIDASFFFGLPELRIPWLRWSQNIAFLLWAVHAAFDFALMFRIQIPFYSVLAGLAKVLWDSELAVDEQWIKESSILNNASLILGKQIITVLPEGYATLNPDQRNFCVDQARHSAYLPIQINSTRPVSIELVRFDLDTMLNETIHIPHSALKKMRKEADKAQGLKGPDTPRTLNYEVKKPGYYKLGRVMDESKLEVRRMGSSAYVVQCPKARIKPSGSNRCRGDLSNVVIEVEGTPPLKLKYRKLVNNREVESAFQSIQPDEFLSPLHSDSVTSGALIRKGEMDINWARSHKVLVPLNESLTETGKWILSLEEVQDGFGNIASYRGTEDEGERRRARHDHLQQSLVVHDRPLVALQGNLIQKPLLIRKGDSTQLPVHLTSQGKSVAQGTKHTIDYMFTPEAELSPNGDHSEEAQLKTVTVDSTQKPVISRNGLYTLKSISSEHCQGEVMEPSSALLKVAPVPSLRLSTLQIFDKCAGNSIGLQVSLDLTGTPPFTVRYTVQKDNGREKREAKNVDGLRGQIDFTPKEAGHYKYTFTEIDDAKYHQEHLPKDLVLEQDVKPAASAYFPDAYLSPKKTVCIDDSVSFPVILQGEKPWALKYELVHGDRRIKKEISGIDDEEITIETEKLTTGGEYRLSLISITDRLGCTEFLQEEISFNVRHQRPKAAFGHIDGKQSVRTLDGKPVALPLKLSGTAPWLVTYRDPSGETHRINMQKANEAISEERPGVYELLEVQDNQCPGTIDATAHTFTISGVPRPGLKLIPGQSLEQQGEIFIKQAVCEGQQDSAEVQLTGTRPFHFKYEIHAEPDKGAKSVRPKEQTLASSPATVEMDTSRGGLYRYRITQISDQNYDHDAKRFTPVVIQQRVNPRPSATFKNPGHTYTYCSSLPGEEDREEIIPITLTGVPPFHVDFEIKQQGAAQPDTISVPNIPSNTYNLRIPHRLLHLGHSNVWIRKVRDARGCEREPNQREPSPRVQISVREAPAIRAADPTDEFCVGDHVSFVLSGLAPFTVYYTFEGRSNTALVRETTFRRVADRPGTLRITGVSDSASDCKAHADISVHIHSLPSVQINQGRSSLTEIQEGGEAEVVFKFSGEPPFEVTWTRSTNEERGRKSRVLETRTDKSHKREMRVRTSEAGTYEALAIADRFCAFSKSDGVPKSWRIGAGAKGLEDRGRKYLKAKSEL